MTPKDEVDENIYHSGNFSLMTEGNGGRLAKAIGGLRLEYEGNIIVVKHPFCGDEIGRGATVKQAIDNAYNLILEVGNA